MKTKLTLDLEKTLYHYWEDLGATVVEEVTMPEDTGIVDTLALQAENDQRIWRCFELKVTKSDFHSSAKLSFVGNYNYFVLTARLYNQVKAEIPAGIGVMTYRAFDAKAVTAATAPVLTPGALTIVRPARFAELQVPEDALTERFIQSLNREVVKAKRVEKGLSLYSDDQLYAELKKRSQNYQLYQPQANLYDRFKDDLQHATISALAEEVDALNAELGALKLKENAR